MTQAEYVAAEERAVERHEYLRGEVFAMAGGSLEHAALASALAARSAEAARANRSEAEALAIRGRFALTALEHLAANGAAQLVVEAMLMRMRAV